MFGYYGLGARPIKLVRCIGRVCWKYQYRIYMIGALPQINAKTAGTVASFRRFCILAGLSTQKH